MSSHGFIDYLFYGFYWLFELKGFKVCSGHNFVVFYNLSPFCTYMRTPFLTWDTKYRPRRADRY